MPRKVRTQIQVNSEIKVNAYRLIADAVDDAITFGVNRSYKHTDAPTRSHIVSEIRNEVMGALCDVLVFEDEVSK